MIGILWNFFHFTVFTYLLISGMDVLIYLFILELLDEANYYLYYISSMCIFPYVVCVCLYVCMHGLHW